jgi:hypothetical protein
VWCLDFGGEPHHVTDYRLSIILAWKKSRALARLIGLRTTCYTRRARLVSSPKTIDRKLHHRARVHTHGHTSWLSYNARVLERREYLARSITANYVFILLPFPYPFASPYFFLRIYFRRDVQRDIVPLLRNSLKANMTPHSVIYSFDVDRVFVISRKYNWGK